MDNLYDQLTALQSIEDAYTLWQTYRETLTTYLLEETSAEETLTLVGIGRSNDVDLGRLAEERRRLVLVDNDEQALKEACRRYQLEAHPYVSYYTKDLVGIEKETYRAYSDDLIQALRLEGQATCLESYAHYVRVYIQEIYDTYCKKTDLVDAFQGDCIVMIGLHSQLLNKLQWIYQVMLDTLGQQEDTVNQLLHMLNQDFMVWLHQQIFSTLPKKVIMGLEQKHIEQKHKVEGAIQAQEIITKDADNQKLQITRTETMVWPFNPIQECSYNMYIQTIVPFKNSL